MIKTEMESMPAEMDEISRKIMQLEIEENALKKETDNLSAAHLAETQKELAALRANYAEMKSKWDNEKNSIGKVPENPRGAGGGQRAAGKSAARIRPRSGFQAAVR